MSDYKGKVESEILSYPLDTNVHDDLPGIFHYWSNKHLKEKYTQVIQADCRPCSFYALHFAEYAHALPHPRFLSIGCGDCALEIEVAQVLRRQGIGTFTFECLDLSVHQLAKAAKAISDRQLAQHFELVETDINSWKPSKAYDGVMAHHSLHHILELEKVFDSIRRCLAPHGAFISNDIIGRNGHMRWPEALEIVDSLWPLLPDRYKQNRQRPKFEAKYENWDCSKQTFEGVRSQDVLPLLVERFEFYKFLACSNLVNIFIDRDFGPNLDPANNEDRSFIDHLELLDRVLIDTGYLKPTIMFAVMGLDKVQPVVYRHWTPTFCIRDPKKP